jgi:dihydrofolate reductase
MTLNSLVVALGLVDEHRLTTHPATVAQGEPLFTDLPSPVRLRLVDSKAFTSAALHVYEPV